MSVVRRALMLGAAGCLALGTTALPAQSPSSGPAVQEASWSPATPPPPSQSITIDFAGTPARTVLQEIARQAGLAHLEMEAKLVVQLPLHAVRGPALQAEGTTYAAHAL